MLKLFDLARTLLCYHKNCDNPNIEKMTIFFNLETGEERDNEKSLYDIIDINVYIYSTAIWRDFTAQKGAEIYLLYFCGGI